MSTNTLALEFSEDILLASGYSREEFVREAKFLLAAKLFEMGKLSAGKAAELCAMNRIDFLFTVGEMGIPVADLDEEELQQEFSDV